MSWDIIIQRTPTTDGTDVVQDEWASVPLGSRAEVIARIKSSFPQADFADPQWGVLRTDAYLIEFSMGGDESSCDSVALHIRGGREALEVIESLTKTLQGQAIDCQSAEVFDIEEARKSFSEWENYRDRTLGE
jgi:hypothetical protein